MKKIIYILIIIASLLFSACETVEAEGEIKVNKVKEKCEMNISVKEVSDISTEYFGVLEFEFKNNSDEWINIKNIRVLFEKDEQNNNVFVVMGKELEAWEKSFRGYSDEEYINKNNFLTAATLISGITAVTAKKDETKDIAKLVCGGAIALSAINSLKESDKMENIDLVSKNYNHILSGDFLIPPGMNIKKIILLNSKKHSLIGYLYSINLEYEMKEGIVEKKKCDFRRNPYDTSEISYSNSKWQKSLLEEINTAKRTGQ